MAERTCIVSRETVDPEGLIRFVAGPDGTVVADLKRNLPGRGVWVTPRRSMVQQAVDKRAFARGLKTQVTAPADLAEQVEALLKARALGAMGFARKAGECLTGAGKVESAVRGDKCIAVLHAIDGEADGLRKLQQAMKQAESADGRPLKLYRAFTSEEMSLALGATHVIHASITNGGAARNFVSRLIELQDYRETEPL